METPPTAPRRSRPSATRGVDEFLNSRVNQVTITLLPTSTVTWPRQRPVMRNRSAWCSGLATG
jgi:hypothetical protein